MALLTLFDSRSVSLLRLRCLSFGFSCSLSRTPFPFRRKFRKFIRFSAFEPSFSNFSCFPENRFGFLCSMYIRVISKQYIAHFSSCSRFQYDKICHIGFVCIHLSC